MGARYTRFLGADSFLEPNVDVGTLDLRVPGSLPVRVYYPAARSSPRSPSLPPSPWFKNGLVYTARGYVRMVQAFAPRLHMVLSSVVLPLLTPLFWLLQLQVPLCCVNAPPVVPARRDGDSRGMGGDDKGQGLPVIVFSHGLTGTSDEHALLFAHWAQRGYVVVAVHHTDGSSSCVTQADGRLLFYQPPDFKSYDTTFRPKQVKRREAELFSAAQFALSSEVVPTSVRDLMDPCTVFVGGFSYGAATAALSAHLHPDFYAGALLVRPLFQLPCA